MTFSYEQNPKAARAKKTIITACRAKPFFHPATVRKQCLITWGWTVGRGPPGRRPSPHRQKSRRASGRQWCQTQTHSLPSGAHVRLKMMEPSLHGRLYLFTIKRLIRKMRGKVCTPGHFPWPHGAVCIASRDHADRYKRLLPMHNEVFFPA